MNPKPFWFTQYPCRWKRRGVQVVKVLNFAWSPCHSSSPPPKWAETWESLQWKANPSSRGIHVHMHVCTFDARCSALQCSARIAPYCQLRPRAQLILGMPGTCRPRASLPDLNNCYIGVCVSVGEWIVLMPNFKSTRNVFHNTLHGRGNPSRPLGSALPWLSLDPSAGIVSEMLKVLIVCVLAFMAG